MTVLLIGDAGEPGKNSGGAPEPVLRAMHALSAAAPDRTVIVYLGDNIYPGGMPVDTSRSSRRRAEAIIVQQIDTTLPRNVQRIFVPGNHDWNDIGLRWYSRGLNRLRAQGGYLDAWRDRGFAVTMAPPPGCPGPAVIDVGSRLRLVALDTEWWLQRELGGGAVTCDAPAIPYDSASSVAALRAAVEGAAERHVVVVAHHPFVSGGDHGGYCPTAFSNCGLKNFWARIRRAPAASWQDIAHPVYTRMRLALAASLAARPPLLYASGHDHDLQVLRGDSTDSTGVVARYFAVSGAGIFGHRSEAACLPTSLAASPESGFMRLDLLRDGSAVLTVVTVAADGVPQPRATFRLTDDVRPGGAGPLERCFI